MPKWFYLAAAKLKDIRFTILHYSQFFIPRPTDSMAKLYRNGNGLR